MQSQITQPNAGSAEPNWFEWLNGLLLVAELLDEEAEVVGVAFQLTGVKGWDDVGVHYRDGRIELMQMKHSRAGDSLTFGDLISTSEDKKSLLASLAEAWDKICGDHSHLKCVLVTNRYSGQNWHKHRPPLELFFAALKDKLKDATSLSDITWDGQHEALREAWNEFRGQLLGIEGRELAFLQSFDIRTGTKDLAELGQQLDDRLCSLSGLPRASIAELRNALICQLQIWTCHTRRESAWVNSNQVRSALVQHEKQPLWLGHCDVETPEPFFESRQSIIEVLKAAVTASEGPTHLFLSAEPGSGKTSCISKLVRDAPLLWQDQPVSLRFYAYRPIMLGRREIGADTGDGVSPDALWLGLLWKLRECLQSVGLLAEFRVPVWLHGLTWSMARDHVLRIASVLGNRWNRAFVIAIDGIDHAARASRKGIPDFLKSLPGPDSIPSRIRLLLAGQPTDAYPEYPHWLKREHTSVRVFPLGELTEPDIRLLWLSRSSLLPDCSTDAVIRLLIDFGKKRTLPTVYAVEDIVHAGSLEEAKATLSSRVLPDSLHEYYEGIWSAALGDARRSVGVSLEAAFVMLRERPTPRLMHCAFPDWHKSPAEWEAILRMLRPLIRETAEGFEVVHNDLRVYLDGQLEGDPKARRAAASCFADYYRQPSSNRRASHETLLGLFREAENDDEFANVFDSRWVIESGSLGITGDLLAEQCHAAFMAAVRKKDWLLLHRVACGSLTLNRLEECLSNSSRTYDAGQTLTPPFLPMEGDTRAFELLKRSDIQQIITTAGRLSEAGEENRARAVLRQWFGSQTVVSVIQRLLDDSFEEEVPGLSPMESYDPSSVMASWGRLACRLKAPVAIGDADVKNPDPKINSGISGFEKGWAESWVTLQDRRQAMRWWAKLRPHFLPAWESAILGTASRMRWGEVRALLRRIQDCVGRFDHDIEIEFSWWALRAGVPNSSPWHSIVSGPRFGLTGSDAPSLTVLSRIANIIGYREPLREPGQVAEELAALLDSRHFRSEHQSSSRLILRAATVIGRYSLYLDRCSTEISILIPWRTLEPLLLALWETHPDWRSLPHEEIATGPQIGANLAVLIWRSDHIDRSKLPDMAARVFLQFWRSQHGKAAFDILIEADRQSWLCERVKELAAEARRNLHTIDYTDRPQIVATLREYVQRLCANNILDDLHVALNQTRIGYSSHNEYIFEPLCAWLELLCQIEPSAWQKQGLRILCLDQICHSQGGDNRFSDRLYEILGSAAISKGCSDIETLWMRLESGSHRWGGLWSLSMALRDGFERLLRTDRAWSDETLFSLIALCIGLGRWPKDSPVNVIDSLRMALPIGHQARIHFDRARSLAFGFYSHQPDFSAASDEEKERQQIQTERTSNVDDLMRRIRSPDRENRLSLDLLAALAEAANKESRIDRSEIIGEALDRLHASDALSRCLEFHSHRLMGKLSRNLTEEEQWRLMGVITEITGEARLGLHDAHWSFMVAFSAVDLLCQERSKNGASEFRQSASEQLIQTQELWSGFLNQVLESNEKGDRSLKTWPAMARTLLLRLLESDSCETVYSAMGGLRFLCEVFPGQIPSVIEQGISTPRRRDAVLSLAEIWALRHPAEMAKSAVHLCQVETEARLDERLQTWLVRSLVPLSRGKSAPDFKVPDGEHVLSISFPGDDGLLSVEPHVDGLHRYNSFAAFTQQRFRRLERILGDLSTSKRLLSAAFKNGSLLIPDMRMKAPEFLSSSGDCPRSNHEGDSMLGNCVQSQFSGVSWSPATAGAVLSAMGGDIDPWVATAFPAPWPDKAVWPQSHDIEQWIERGGRENDETCIKLEALVSGSDLSEDEIVVGAVLSCPTYRRDLSFWYWLEDPSRSSNGLLRSPSTTMSARCFSNFFGGWICGANGNTVQTSVHFAGTLISYPNTDLEVTPTNDWIREWGWEPSLSNPLRWNCGGSKLAARYEQWRFPDGISGNRTCRIPLLRRWVASKAAFPIEYQALSEWRRRTEKRSGLLSQPE